MSDFLGTLLGIDAWGVWFPGIFFLLAQNAVALVVCGSPLFEGHDLLSSIALFTLAFAAGSTLQFIGTLLTRKWGNGKAGKAVKCLKDIFWLDFLRKPEVAKDMFFSNRDEADVHRNIRETLAPGYEEDNSVINHYEAILTKANPAAYKRTVELMNSISIQRTFAVAFLFLAVECLILAMLGIPFFGNNAADLLGFTLSTESHYAVRLVLLALGFHLLSLGLYSLSCWLWSFRSRFICRNVACFRDEPWAALPNLEDHSQEDFRANN